MLGGPAAYCWHVNDVCHLDRSHKDQDCNFEPGSQVSAGTDTLNGGHGPRGAPVESATEAPINGKNRSQHLLQPNPLVLLLLHDANNKA